ncbi:class I SAM-dependent methyltransferase [Pilimelia columellifera]|uniref:Methyltransferase type 11 domain-containing protein n=1 Tax=Pilimelia columellifera subsp. columellifera TaxID=706583 RepID=A0ABN3NTC8_9ACTN
MTSQATVDAAYAVYVESPLLRQVHGPEHLNVGWRAGGEADPSAALVDRLLNLVPGNPSVVLDVACGRAAASRQMALRWPQATVLGVDRSAVMLPPAPAARPGVARAEATALPIADGAADLVLCVEAALHFTTRRDFFAEAARVLRPGGLLILTDLLVDPAGPGWAPLVPAGNRETTRRQYADALRSAGLIAQRITDITAQTWTPYTDALVAAAGDEAASAAVRRILSDRPVAAYVEVVAQR